MLSCSGVVAMWVRRSVARSISKLDAGKLSLRIRADRVGGFSYQIEKTPIGVQRHVPRLRSRLGVDLARPIATLREISRAAAVCCWAAAI